LTNARGTVWGRQTDCDREKYWQQMPFESFKWKGPTKGGRSRALPVPTSGGATGTPRTLPQRPRPSVHKIRRRDAAPSQRLVEVPRGSATDPG